MSDARPIGVYDSGVGGLTVVKQLEENLPEEHIIYVGDTAKAPYGEKTAEQIRQYSREIITFLLEFDVKLVLASSNTTSALALPRSRKSYQYL